MSKFIVNSSTLLKTLQKTSGIKSTRVLPICDSFKFETIPNNRLKITSSDLETTITTECSCECNESASVCIPKITLLEILKNTADQPLTFTVEKKPTEKKDEFVFIVHISTDNGKYSITGFNAEEFPNLPQMEGLQQSISIPSDILLRGIKQTEFAIGDEEMATSLSSLYFEFTSGGLITTSCDRFRLSSLTFENYKTEQECDFMIHRSCIPVLKSLLLPDADVSIVFDGVNAIFTIAGTVLYIRLTDGKYPAYRNIIPQNNSIKIIIDRYSLIQTTKRVISCSNKNSPIIEIKIIGSEMTVSASDVDFGNNATERLTCQHEGDDIRIGFNALYLIGCLSAMDWEYVDWEMNPGKLNKHNDLIFTATTLTPNVPSGDIQEKIILMPTAVSS